MLCIPNNFWVPQPISMKLGMYIMAPEPISTAYFITPITLCVHLCTALSLLGNGSEKNPLSLLGNSLVKSYHGNEDIINNRRTVAYQGKWAITSSKIFVSNKVSRRESATFVKEHTSDVMSTLEYVVMVLICTRFKFWPGHWFPDAFHSFSQSMHANVGRLPYNWKRPNIPH
jgi:hypothetical protein